MRAIVEIIVHCSATRPEWMAGHPVASKVSEIRRWHVSDNGWSDIGYHVIIDRDGAVAYGRPFEKEGAHTRGHNAATIGVCLIGGHGSSETDAPEKNFTPIQLDALRTVIADLRGRFPSIALVSGHNQYAAKACPGFNAPAWYRQVSAEKPVKSQEKANHWLAIFTFIMSLFGRNP